MGTDYEQLIRPVEKRLLRTIWRVVRDPDDADDVLQDALERIWRRLDQVRRHPNPRALILRICLNAAYDAVRARTRRKRHEAAPELADRVSGEAVSPHDQLALEESHVEVLHALARLSRHQAAAVILRFADEESYADRLLAALRNQFGGHAIKRDEG